MPRKSKKSTREKEPKPPVFKSGLEKKVAACLERHGVEVKYEKLKLPYVVPSKKKNYIPDFQLPNGIIIEAKGKLDALAREKMSLVIAQHPELDIRMLLMRDNKLNKKHKTKYSDWLRKHGIKFAVSEIGEVPREWIDER